jgi:uncharacterized protein (DUF433 family)
MLTMTWTDHIRADPTILVGKPIIKGTRLSVELILGLLAQGWSEADLLKSYPPLTIDDIRACLQYAAEIIGSEKVYPLRAA